MTNDSTLCYIPKRTLAHFQQEICIRMFIGTLFPIAKAWSNPKTHQQNHKWKSCDIFTQWIEYYVSEKRTTATCNNIMINFKSLLTLHLTSFMVKKPTKFTHTYIYLNTHKILWIYKKEIHKIHKKKSKGMNQHRNHNDGNVSWEKTAKWYVVGETHVICRLFLRSWL